MPDLDELRRTYSRVEAFSDFHPEQRIWWIYMRNAAIEVASRNYAPGLQAGCDLVKAFPENLLDERGRWLRLREEVARTLESGLEQFQQQPRFLGVLPVATGADDVEREQADDAILALTYGRGLARVRGSAE